MRQMRIYLLIAFITLVGANTAHAEQFIKPSYIDLLKTLVRFNAIELSDNDVIDEYAIATECKTYVAYYRDDFAWQKFRQVLRASLQQDAATIPASYYYDAEVQLDRYDFKESMYQLTAKSAPSNVNSFIIYSASDVECGNGKVLLLPKSFRLVLDQSLHISGIPLVEADAKLLLQRMEINDNRDRLIYARFNLRVVDVPPFRRPKAAGNETKVPLVQDIADPSRVRMKAQLGSVDFYEDKGHTKLIYSYRP